MAHEKDTKLKRPYSAAELQALEDGVAEILECFRDIRLRMSQNKMTQLELKAGTFKFYLEKMRLMSLDFQTEVKKQHAISAAKETRQQILKRRATEK